MTTRVTTSDRAAFARRVVQLARIDEGMAMLLELLVAEDDPKERKRILGDMAELVADHET